MNNAKILSHPTFDRPPTLNRRGPGRLPRGIVSLAAHRRTTAPYRIAAEETALRMWAYVNGVNAHADIRALRAAKQEREAIDRILKSGDSLAWREIERLKEMANRLYNAAFDARYVLIDRHIAESGQ